MATSPTQPLTSTEKRVKAETIQARYRSDMERFSRLAKQKALRNNCRRGSKHMSFDEALAMVMREELAND